MDLLSGCRDGYDGSPRRRERERAQPEEPTPQVAPMGLSADGLWATERPRRAKFGLFWGLRGR
jgi:hypothetical protein